jgi:hypothetical protein
MTDVAVYLMNRLAPLSFLAFPCPLVILRAATNQLQLFLSDCYTCTRTFIYL